MPNLLTNPQKQTSKISHANIFSTPKPVLDSSTSKTSSSKSKRANSQFYQEPPEPKVQKTPPKQYQPPSNVTVNGRMPPRPPMYPMGGPPPFGPPPFYHQSHFYPPHGPPYP